MVKKIRLIIFILIIFTFGFALCWIFFPNKITSNNSNCKNNYYYINPLLGCEVKLVIRKTGYAEFKNKLESYIENKNSTKEASQISVYFRDLVFGPWFGIDEYDEFSPASLLKLPVMLAYLKIAEENTDLLSRKLTITSIPENEQKQFFKPKETIEKGKSYEIEELIRRMIIYSDNRASSVLLEYLYEITKEDDPITQTLKETGTLVSEVKPGEVINVKSYASLFRLLYNTSYLSEAMSEKALKILSDVKYVDGLRGGILPQTKIAHKFGERFDEKSRLNQLHDCGIVYFPKNSYLLCVMTKGEDFNKLSKIIRDISKMVYEEVDSRKISD